MASLASQVQQTQQEDYNQVHHDGEQDGRENIKVQFSSDLTHSSKTSRTRKWICKWSRNLQVISKV